MLFIAQIITIPAIAPAIAAISRQYCRQILIRRRLVDFFMVRYGLINDCALSAAFPLQFIGILINRGFVTEKCFGFCLAVTIVKHNIVPCMDFVCLFQVLWCHCGFLFVTLLIAGCSRERYCSAPFVLLAKLRSSQFLTANLTKFFRYPTCQTSK